MIHSGTFQPFASENFFMKRNAVWTLCNRLKWLRSAGSEELGGDSELWAGSGWCFFLCSPHVTPKLCPGECARELLRALRPAPCDGELCPERSFPQVTAAGGRKAGAAPESQPGASTPPPRGGTALSFYLFLCFSSKRFA